ncbi:uncharacterized protein LOC100844366 [Brachypodium distachyon]|uniref:DUF7866 domain-containing protein n=1 Tax=Brachypodium distachyon TaxID=15368 RepID=I1HUK7_BRADI|nr:uncharacterized protein LOC100844366 [Brachypodium distachyon]KQK11205.1 hypothetical protein BRADI_2g58760v3 [Brachypodium distachyon]|eukprot:XP_003567400.1 uncharacterized protein LOC100844366 [Brachypodium distachyon]
MMPALTPNLLFLLLLFLAATSSSSQPQSQVPDASAVRMMVPMSPAAGTGYSAVVLNETRRRLGSFQLCAPCTCCGGARGVCVPCPCCYAINCNIPNRPFGFCSFTPKSCDCLGCHP